MSVVKERRRRRRRFPGSRRFARHSLPIAGFVLLTLVLTYPLPLHLPSGVRDPGDPLLNAWILAWEVHSVSSGEPGGLFNANIFFPHERTLAFSELLLPQAAVAAPLLIASGNPVLAYNVVFLLSFIATATAMYLLAWDLTRARLPAFVAGLVFAFPPFMFSHLSHLQMVFAAGIPLAFRHLHRFFDTGRSRELALFVGFYLMQMLANGHYGLYLTVFAGGYGLYRTIADDRYREPGFWARIAVAAAVVVLIAGPFWVQYLHLRWDLGFRRSLGYYAVASSFLATPAFNVVYGAVTEPFRRPEAELFPGLVPVVLAAIGLFAYRRRAAPAAAPNPDSESPAPAVASRDHRRSVRLLRALELVLLSYVGLLFFVALTGGFVWSVGPVPVRATHARNLVIAIALLSIARGALLRRDPNLRSWLPSLRAPAGLYALVLGAAFLFTFGPTGPYLLLYEHVPGFDGLRVASRFQIFVMFGLAVLAAFGAKTLLERWSRTRHSLAWALILPILVCVEYASVPVPVSKVPVNDEIPLVYRWLAAHGDDFAIVELPIERRADIARVYYSTYHWKALANGYSGYIPLLYRELSERSRAFPSRGLLEDLQVLGVRYVILHSDQYEPRHWKRIRRALPRFGDRLRLVGEFDGAYVYRILQGAPREPPLPRGDRLTRAGWRVRARPLPAAAGLAVDGDLATRWHTRKPQRPGAYFEIDLGAVVALQRVTLALGGSLQDYPRGCLIEVSTDRVRWRTVENAGCRVPLPDLVDPRNLTVDVRFAPVEGRYLRITQTGAHRRFYWSIHELDIYGPTAVADLVPNRPH